MHKVVNTLPRPKTTLNPLKLVNFVKKMKLKAVSFKFMFLKNTYTNVFFQVLEDTANPPPPPYMPGGYAEPYVPASTAPTLPPLHLPPPGYPAAQTTAPSANR